MFHWTPSSTTIESWKPRSGWNASFSEQDKIQCTNLFFFFKSKKGYKENMAEILAQMVLYKQKFHGMKYSEEQERLLQEALRPVFNS